MKLTKGLLRLWVSNTLAIYFPQAFRQFAALVLYSYKTSLNICIHFKLTRFLTVQPRSQHFITLIGLEHTSETVLL